MTDIKSQVLLALAKVTDPELGLPITELGMVGDIGFDSDSISVEIKLTVSHCPMRDQIESEVIQVLSQEFPTRTVNLQIAVMSKAELDELKVRLRGKEKQNPFGPGSSTRVILIGSGKGGVGKSTITANLAVALANSGYQVGLIDADIFGFSITRLMGIKAKPTRLDDMMLPPISYGVKVISIGMFLDDNEAISWRGPMLHKAIEQFLTDVYWGDLDFLLIDMPPGTGDVAISIGQLLPNAKTIVVTTAATAASQVAVRSAMAASKAGHEIIGVVENMSWLLDREGKKQALFGSGGGDALVAELSRYTNQAVPLLAQIPISTELSESAEVGRPLLSLANSDEAANTLQGLAGLIAQTKLSKDQRALKVKLKP